MTANVPRLGEVPPCREFNFSTKVIGGILLSRCQAQLRIINDKLKNDYCLKMGIKLIRIGYLDMNDIKNQIDKALESNDMLWLSDKYPQNEGWRDLK